MNKKKLLALLMAGTMVVGTVALAGCDGTIGGNDGTGGGNDGTGGGGGGGSNNGKATAITIWVSETEGIKTLTETQINAFMESHADYKGKYNITVEGVTEGEAATKMVTDVSTGADIFCFAQDQLGRLIEAKALSKLGVKATEFVTTNNDAGAARAATVSDGTYAYPITSDNGYFMYYDKGVLEAKDENGNPVADIDDLASIVSACEAAEKKFAYELEGSAWYTASFFFATGCTSSWTMDAETMKWTAADNFNSAEGIIALKGMQILTKSPAYVNSSKAAEFGDAEVDDEGNTTVHGGAAVVVSGTWDSSKAKEKLGDNYGVAKLPKFTVDGKSYQLGSYAGYKLMGVKPHTDAPTQAFCNELAQHLSGREAQEARFDSHGWGPSNKEVQQLDKVKEDEALSALSAQNEFATPQGTIHGGWWDFAKLLGGVSKNANNDADLQKGLDDYSAALSKYEQMTEDDMNAFGIIGKIASLATIDLTADDLAAGQNKWSEWGADLRMTKSEKDGAEIWKSNRKVTLANGDQFQVRKGQAWSEQYGALGDDGYSTKNNFVITEDNAGEWYIVLTVTTVDDKSKGVVTLVAE